MASNLMQPSSLLETALSLLPGTTILASPLEALFLLIHSIQTNAGFRLIGSPEGSTVGLLGVDWQIKSHKDGFKYRHEQSSLEFQIKLVEIGGRGMIIGIALEDNKTSTFDIPLLDFFSPSAFPFTITISPEPDATNTKPEEITHLFIHSTRLTDLITRYRTSILQKLIPGLRKDGYTELTETSTLTSGGEGASSSGSRPQPVIDPSRGYYPDLGGPMGVPRPNSNRNPINVQSPFNIGRSDLEPLGGIGGPLGSGMGGIGGGGMMVGPDHPLFRDRFGSNNPTGSGDDFMRGGIGGLGEGMRGTNGNGERWGGDGYLPPMGAPPGARFDPIGPGNMQPRNGGRPLFPGDLDGGMGLPGRGMPGMPRGGGGGSGGNFGGGNFGGGGFGGGFRGFAREPIDDEEVITTGTEEDHSEYDQMFS